MMNATLPRRNGADVWHWMKTKLIVKQMRRSAVLIVGVVCAWMAGLYRSRFLAMPQIAAMCLLVMSVGGCHREAEIPAAQSNQVETAASNPIPVVAGSQFAEARAKLTTQLEHRPDWLQGRRQLAALLNARGFRSEANGHLRQMMKSAPLDLRELSGLIYPLRPYVSFASKPNVNDANQVQSYGPLSVSMALRFRGDNQEALTCLLQARSLEIDRDEALAFRGWLFAILQLDQELTNWAVKEDDRSRRNHCTYWMAIGRLARLHTHPISLDCFVEALRLEPNCGEALEAIIEDLQRQIAIQPDAQSQVWLDRFHQRQLAIAEINAMVNAWAQSPESDPTLIMQLADRIESVGRPLEAVTWQQMHNLRVAPELDTSTAIQAVKSNILSVFPSGCDEAEIVCGYPKLNVAAVDDFLSGIKQRDPLWAAEPQPDLSQHQALPIVCQQPVFTNVAKRCGLSFRYRNAKLPVFKEFRLYEPLGPGMACLDFDLDGAIDLYLAQADCDPDQAVLTSEGQQGNALFRQVDGRFQNVATLAQVDDLGYALGVTAGDWNQDGFADIAVANIGVNRLFINQGDGTYQPAKLNGRWLDGQMSACIAIADVTGDHLPDLVEINYVDDPRVFNPIERTTAGKPRVLPAPKQFQPAISRVFVSRGDGSAEGTPLGQSLSQHASTGLGLLVCDLDQQPGNEVFVANDQNTNHLWARQGESWIDRGLISGVGNGPNGRPLASMGIAAADFDGNGLLDLHVTNYVDEWSNLYLQSQPLAFVDRSSSMQLDVPTIPMVGFGTQVIDYDNNTTPDLLIGNGHVEDFESAGVAFQMPTQLLTFDRQRFQQATVAGDDEYWTGHHLTRAVVRCDWNRDGLCDAITTDVLADPALLENRTSTAHHWLQLQLIGVQSERDAIGAKVTVTTEQGSWQHWVQAGDGYMSKNESKLFIGLGSATQIQQATVHWPSGAVQSQKDLPINADIVIVEGDHQLWVNLKRDVQRPVP